MFTIRNLVSRRIDGDYKLQQVSLAVNPCDYVSALETDDELVSEFVKATSEYSLREAGRLVGVSHQTISKWRAGLVGELQPATRRALRSFLAERAAAEANAEAHAAEGLLSSLDEVMRTLRKIDPEPGSQMARKKDALRLMRELMATLGESLPDWFWDIQERVERGEL